MAFFSPPTDLRASDDDRERLADLLKAHYAAGRLDEAEFSARASAAYAAVYLSELDALTRDLPSLSLPVAPRRPVPSAPLLRTALLLLGVIAVLALLPPELWLVLAILAVPLVLILLFVVAPLALPVLVVALIARAVLRPRARARP